MGRLGNALRSAPIAVLALFVGLAATGAAPNRDFDGGGVRAPSAGSAGARPSPSLIERFIVLGANLDTEPALLSSALEESAGIGDVLRIRLDWAAIETSRGTYAWSSWDAAARALRADGRQVLAVVDTAPAWARHDPPWPAAWWVPCEDEARSWPEAMPPTDPADLARFLGAFVTRYRDILIGVEVWREPNTVPHWRRTGPDPEGYADLLVQAGQAVRAAAPELWVVSAGLTPTTDVGPCHMSDYVFLDRLARTGALATVDAVGVEISSFERPVTDPAVDREVLNVRRAELSQRVLVRHGIERPIWIVAALRGDHRSSDDDAGDGAGNGAGNGAGDGAGPPVAPDAAWFAAVLDMARAEWPWLGALFVGNFAAPSAPVAARDGQRIVLAAADGRPTPLGAAIREAMTGLALPTFGAWPNERTLAALSERPHAGSARIVRPWPERPVRAALLVVFAVVGAVATWAMTAWGGRQPFFTRAAHRFAAVVRPPTGGTSWRSAWRGPWSGRAVLVALVLADGAVGWPLNAPLVPAMVVAATVWPLAAVWLVGAATPFYFAAYALDMAPALGPASIGPVELLIAVAVAGSGARWLLDRAAGSHAGRAATRDTANGDAATGDTPIANGATANRATANTAVALRPLRSLHPADVGVLVLVAWAALTPLWAEEPALAWREWRTVIAEPAAYYAVLRLWPNRRAAAGAAWHGIVAGATVAALWALVGMMALAVGWDASAGAGAVAAEGVLRAQGPYNSPNNLALILGRVCLGLAAGWVFTQAVASTGARRSAPRSADDGITARRVRNRFAARRASVGWPAFVVCTAALVATFSRGTVLVGLPAAMLWLGVLAARGRLGRRAVGWAVAAALGIALVLVPFAGTERVARALVMEPGTTLYYRVRLWQSSVQMGLDHPVLGVGLDNFMGLFRDRYVQRDVIQERFLSHPHNIALDWWTRLGLPGAVLLAAWLVWFARAAVHVVVAGPNADRTAAAVGVGALVYGLSHGLLDNSFFLVDLAVYTWVAQALVLAALEPNRSAWAHQDSNLGPTGYEPAALTAEL